MKKSLFIILGSSSRKLRDSSGTRARFECDVLEFLRTWKKTRKLSGVQEMRSLVDFLVSSRKETMGKHGTFSVDSEDVAVWELVSFCGGVVFRRSATLPWIFAVDNWIRGQQPLGSQKKTTTTQER